MIHLILVDDHHIFLDGIASLLSGEPDMELKGIADTAEQAIELIAHVAPHIAVVDINLPGKDGIELTRSIKEDHPETRVLILTMSDEFTIIKTALEAGADGYLLKNAGKTEFLEAVRKVAKGESFYSSQVTERLLTGKSMNYNGTFSIELTKREIEVLVLVCQELSTQEIADKLFISTHTAETHRRNLLSKTGCKNSVGLVKFAIDNHLI